MLNLELGDHGELGTLLDLEWIVLQGALGALGGEVDGDWWAASSVHGEGEDDAMAGIGRIGEGRASEETKGGLVALKGLILGV